MVWWALQYDDLIGVFSGLAAAHDAGSYTINLKNDQIGQLLERIDMQIEQGQLDKIFAIDWEPLLTPYVDAVIEGMKDAEKIPLAVQFENAVSKGLEVNASICAGKDGAAGTYAFEVTIEAEIPDKLQEEWGIKDLSPVVGETEGLLTQTDEPITVIAGKVGYTNTSKFSEAFKKVKGKTPLEYRKIKI